MPATADGSWDALLKRIGGNITRHRIAVSLTQAALAERLEVAEEHLRRVEGGKRAPSLHLLHRCAAELSTDVSVLLADVPPPKRNPGRPPRDRGL